MGCRAYTFPESGLHGTSPAARSRSIDSGARPGGIPHATQGRRVRRNADFTSRESRRERPF